MYLIPKDLPTEHVFETARLNIAYRKIPEFLFGLKLPKFFGFEIDTSKNRHVEFPILININYLRARDKKFVDKFGRTKSINPIATVSFFSKYA